jgi:hypothetical protein
MSMKITSEQASLLRAGLYTSLVDLGGQLQRVAEDEGVCVNEEAQARCEFITDRLMAARSCLDSIGWQTPEAGDADRVKVANKHRDAVRRAMTVMIEVEDSIFKFRGTRDRSAGVLRRRIRSLRDVLDRANIARFEAGEP